MEKFEALAARDDSGVQLTFAGAKKKLRVGYANLTETETKTGFVAGTFASATVGRQPTGWIDP